MSHGYLRSREQKRSGEREEDERGEMAVMGDMWGKRQRERME